MALYFAVTLFVSAFLLFLVQPMVGKMVLPLAGGSPAVWATCMVFFQALLLAGYSYAHAAIHRLGARRQSTFHFSVLALPLVAMGVSAVLSGGSPIYAFKSLAPAGGVFPFVGVLLLLTAAIGLPFFVIATSAPLLQRWFADTNHPDARDPYFLYSASNLGSLIALVGYPVLIEPTFRLTTQGWLWAGGYLALVALTAGCAARLRASPPPATGPAAKRPDPAQFGSDRPSSGAQSSSPAKHSTHQKRVDPAPTWADRLRWLGLAAVPTSLLLGLTTFVTTDITPMPLLWVVPLAIYLLTFIIAFGRAPSWFQKAIELVAPVAVLILLFTMLGKKPDSWVVNILLHLGTFFLVALNCHLDLARRRPAASRLTEFFLWVSVGGVLGGLFNALVAPLVFNELFEYPLALIAACLLLPPGDSTESPGTSAWIFDLLVPLGVGALTLVLLQVPLTWLPTPTAKFPIPRYGPWDVLSNTLWYYLVYGLPMLAAYFWVDRPLRFGLAIAALWVVGTMHDKNYQAEWHDDGWGGLVRTIHRDRSFFGVLTVEEWQDKDGGPIYHKLVHGTTLHGKQQFDPVGNEPLSYYHRTGPIGQVFAEKLPAVDQRAYAVVGLGSGTMAAYAEQGQPVTYYEIDPVVKGIAQDPQYLTFLRDCKGVVQIVMGDARLKMEEHGRDGEYGVIVVDAFSSDAIPVHLLTKEAVALYRSRLAPGGIIALHISNRYLDLKPVAARIAEELGMVGLHQWDSDSSLPGKQSSEWVILANNRADFGGLVDRTYEGEDDNGSKVTRHRWDELKSKAGDPLWTDDYSNLLQIAQHLPKWLEKLVK